MIIKDKKAMEMAISTLILIVLGIMILVGLISALILQWDNLAGVVNNYMGSDTQQAIDACENDCSFSRQFDFCCTDKKINNVGVSCNDLNVTCSNIRCEGVC